MDGDRVILNDEHTPRFRNDATGATGPGARHLFVAAGGGGDVLAACILQRMLYGDGPLPYVVTYSWDRLMTDPLPGPRGPSSFENLQALGEHNVVVSARSSVGPPGRSLLPRLADELSTRFYLLDPYRGAKGMRSQLAELVAMLGIERVSLVDSGGDILATGDERELRSPLADSLVLAAADDIGAPVDILVTGTGLDGELSPPHVRGVVIELGGEVGWRRLAARDVERFVPVLRWHPSEVNGLLIAAAMGFRGTVELRDAALKVRVEPSSAAVHRCGYDAAIANNRLAKSLTESESLEEAECTTVATRDYSEIGYQRANAKRYGGEPLPAWEIDQRLTALLDYGTTRSGVDALTLRRAAEVMGIRRDELEALGPTLRARFPQRFAPPLWKLR